jgi:hypothetical protein
MKGKREKEKGQGVYCGVSHEPPDLVVIRTYLNRVDAEQAAKTLGPTA